jgi:hypothetical protein
MGRPWGALWIAIWLVCGAACDAKDKPADAARSNPHQTGDERATDTPETGGSPAPSDTPSAGPRALFDRPGQAPKSIHPTERFLYWSENTFADGPRILRAPIDGKGEPSAISDTENVLSLGVITSDAQFVYWVEAERVVRMPHDGSERKDISLPVKLSYPYLSRNGDFLYAADLGCNHAVRIDTRTLEISVLRSIEAMIPGGASVSVSDGTWLYCSTGSNATVLAIPTSGGDAKTLVQIEAGYHVLGMALAGKQLYMLQVPKSLGQVGQSVLRVATDGGTPESLVTTDTYGGGSLLQYDQTHDSLYWLDAVGVPGTIFRYAVQQRELTHVVDKRKLDGDLAIDAHHVFFGELDPGGIFIDAL